MILRNDYGDLENGFILEIMITNHCNLNCMGCDHYAPVSKPFCMSYEELEKSLIMLKKQGMDKYIKEFFLLGGEPFLNKNLISYLPLIKKYFPNSNIDILTNGSLINKLSENDLNTIKIVDAHISVTKYPVQIDYQNIENTLNNNDIKWRYLATRALFQQSLINVNGSENAKNNFEKCARHKFPCLTMQDYKIFFCPDACCIPHIKNLNIINSEDDYLDIATITIQKIKNFCTKEKSICAYCKNDTTQALMWHNHLGLKEYYYTLKDYFLYDYDNYLKIIDNPQLADYFFDDNIIKSIDYVYQTKDLYNLLYQYKYSKIDIIIPFYNVDQQIMEQLKDELLRQTFIKECVIYFISDNSPYAEQMFDFFHNIQELNCIFLKNQHRQGPGAARNVGIKHAHGQYLYFLDVDDGFFNNSDLKELYTIINQDDKDVLLLPCKVNDSQKNSGTKVLVKNSYVQKNHIFFPELYINEDFCFLEFLALYNPNAKEIQHIQYKYNRGQYKGSIGYIINTVYPSVLFTFTALYLYLIKIHAKQEIIERIKNEFLSFCTFYKDFLQEDFTKKYGLDVMQYLLYQHFYCLNTIKDWDELKIKVENIMKESEDYSLKAAYNFYLTMKGD